MPIRPCHSVRALARLAVVASVALLAGPATAVPASADPARSVQAQARASGMRATYTMADFVAVSEFFDAGGPVAQALADSTGRATSFSSLPYPGVNAVNGPRTAAVVTGQSSPFGYPFYVEADYPTVQHAGLSDPSGTYALAAAAGAGRAAASGSLGGGGSGSFADTSVVLDDAGVTKVAARSVSSAIDIGDGLLTITSVTSRSEATLGPGDDQPVTRTALVIEGASVGGQPVVIDAGGVHVADNGAPVPIGQGSEQLNERLKAAGLSVQVLKSSVPGVADALVITSRHQIPGNPPGLFVWRIGGAATEILIGADG
jgi:hypothetical protein